MDSKIVLSTSNLKNKKPKVLVLILCSRNYLSYISSKTQKKLWDKYSSKYQIQHFIGNPYLAEREVDYVLNNQSQYLHLDVSDNYQNIAKKTFLALEFINLNYDFDYIFRTNTSSFIDFRKFEKYISDNIENIDYSGSTLKASEGDTIASGAGFFLSKKNVEIIVNNKKEFNASLPDDVAIARLLSQFNIVPNDLRRKDLKAVPSPGSVFNSDHFHYRCRLDPQYHRILEPLLMRYLDRVSKNTRFLSFINYYFLKLIFNFSNIQVIYKIIQKYYSFKFYGEINIGKKTIFSIQKNGLKN